MFLWLARHAAPLIAPGTCYGALDIPADDEATRQAAAHLAHALPGGMAVACSPLQRCRQLASALMAQRADLPARVDDRLREMDFGQWEGRSWHDIGAEPLAAWTADFAHHRPGGGENVHDFMHRVAEAWDEWAAVPIPTVWITHAGVIRAVRLLADGVRQVDRADMWPAVAPAFGRWTQVASPGRKA